MKNAHADIENRETILAILFQEIMDRVVRLSKEEQKNLKNAFKALMNTGLGITVPLEDVSPEVLRTYLLLQSSGSDEDRFAYELDYFLSTTQNTGN